MLDENKLSQTNEANASKCKGLVYYRYTECEIQRFDQRSFVGSKVTHYRHHFFMKGVMALETQTSGDNVIG